MTPLITEDSACRNCKRYREIQEQNNILVVSCQAFIKGVPDNIRLGLDNHRAPVQGDHGLLYQAIDE